MCSELEALNEMPSFYPSGHHHHSEASYQGTDEPWDVISQMTFDTSERLLPRSLHRTYHNSADLPEGRARGDVRVR